MLLAFTCGTGTNTTILICNLTLQNSKKYFKRGELLAKEQEEYLQKFGQSNKETEEEKQQEEKREKSNEVILQFFDFYTKVPIKILMSGQLM